MSDLIDFDFISREQVLLGGVVDARVFATLTDEQRQGVEVSIPSSLYANPLDVAMSQSQFTKELNESALAVAEYVAQMRQAALSVVDGDISRDNIDDIEFIKESLLYLNGVGSLKCSDSFSHLDGYISMNTVANSEIRALLRQAAQTAGEPVAVIVGYDGTEIVLESDGRTPVYGVTSEDQRIFDILEGVLRQISEYEEARRNMTDFAPVATEWNEGSVNYVVTIAPDLDFTSVVDEERFGFLEDMKRGYEDTRFSPPVVYTVSVTARDTETGCVGVSRVSGIVQSLDVQDLDQQLAYADNIDKTPCEILVDQLSVDVDAIIKDATVNMAPVSKKAKGGRGR